MNTMRVYHISPRLLNKKSEEALLEPRIPKSIAKGEENETPRICCAPTVIGCLYAMEAVSHCYKDMNNDIQLYLYQADVPVEKLYQPFHKEVEDAFYTGELWILEPQIFHLVNPCIMREQMPVGDTGYYRFSFRWAYLDEVVDRKIAHNIYGEPESFSFIEFNYLRDYEHLLDSPLE